MSISISVDGAKINKPGAYSRLKVAPLTGFPLSTTGVIGLVGPADAGAPGLQGPFSKANIQKAKEMFKSGPLADAIDLVINPSGDERIVNGASEIYFYKTNNSTQAILDMIHGKAITKNYGLTANKVALAIEEAQHEVKPTFLFTFVAPAVDATFGARVNGKVLQTVSIVNADTAATAATKINGLNGISAVNNAGIITVVVDEAFMDGAGMALEIVDGAGTNALTTIGVPSNVIGSLLKSASEQKVQYTLSHPDFEDEVSALLGGVIAMEIGYKGTSCSMVISNEKINTTVVGGVGASLEVLFSNYNNLKEIVDFINAQPGYSCSTSWSQALASSPTILDNVSIEIASSADALKPGRVKVDSYLFAKAINENSQLISYEEKTEKGLPVAIEKTYLAGGTLGTAANSDFQKGFDAFKLSRINVVVATICQNGLAEGYGTYDLESVAVQLNTHVKWGWSTDGKSEREGKIGYKGNKEGYMALCRALSSAFVQVTSQRPKRNDAAGNLKFLPEWAMGCLLGGMRCGSEVGEPLTYKYINALGVEQDVSWNPKTDYSELIDAGCTFVESVDSGGFRVVVDNTTYGKDANFVWNRGSVTAAGGYIAYDLRQALESKFTGNKAKTGTRTAILNFIKARMNDYFRNDIIVADDSAPDGYKDLDVVVDGNQAIINGTVYPVQGIDFLINTIYLDSSKQSA